jgi:replicative DNA helicase
VAGRPGDGKTQILLEIALAQWLEGKSVLIVSMEMRILQLLRRWVGRYAGLNPNMIRAGELSTNVGEPRLRQALAYMQENGQRIYMLDGDFRKDVVGIEQLVREYNPDSVLIDGAYLLTEEGKAVGHIKRWESVAAVSNAIKRDICLALNKPCIATFQLNRNVRRGTNNVRQSEGEDGEQSQRYERDPDLNDVAGSDAAPQDASLVMTSRRGRAPHAYDRRRLNLIKNREGEEGEFEIHFEFNPPRFDEVIETEEEELSQDWMLA